MKGKISRAAVGSEINGFRIQKTSHKIVDKFCVPHSKAPYHGTEIPLGMRREDLSYKCRLILIKIMVDFSLLSLIPLWFCGHHIFNQKDIGKWDAI